MSRFTFLVLFFASILLIAVHPIDSQAAELGQTRSRPMWVRPRRSFTDRLMGRAAASRSNQTGFDQIGVQLQQLLAGGIYYLEPSVLLGGYSSD